MKKVALATSFWLAFAMGVVVAQTPEAPLTWAYPVNPPGFQRRADDGSIRLVPDSTARYTLTEVRDLFAPPDWHLHEHPAMPSVVAVGRKPDVMACGVCHRADGPGGPESSSLFGLPADYIVQQTLDFKNGLRRGSLPRVPKVAATYFASIKPRANINVVETEMVPKTEVRELFLTRVEGSNDQEAIGQRIIEIPENLELFISRDTHAKFIAYVPQGSIDRGRKLVMSGDPSAQCTACHGVDLRGSDVAPRIAGRSPTYLFRQLNDFKTGARKGQNSEAMKSVVEKLAVEDFIGLAAYSASLAPSD